MKKEKIILPVLIFAAALFCAGCSDRASESTGRSGTDLSSSRAESDNSIGQTGDHGEEAEKTDSNLLYLTAGNTTFTAVFAENSSAEAFKEKLAEGDITVLMSDYGNFEKVGDLGFSLPRNDTRINKEPGDIILYQGNSVTIYYDTNTWSFTRLAKIENVSGEELLSVLGSGDVSVTFSLNNQ